MTLDIRVLNIKRPKEVPAVKVARPERPEGQGEANRDKNLGELPFILGSLKTLQNSINDPKDKEAPPTRVHLIPARPCSMPTTPPTRVQAVPVASQAPSSVDCSLG